MDDVQLPQLWTAAAVLAGFQLTAIGWRIRRELHMESMNERTWLTLADGFVGVSFLLFLGGVFAAPILGGVPPGFAAKCFGLAFVWFAASPFVLAGHYNLYGGWCKRPPPRPWATVQEKVVAGVSLVFVVGYVGAWIFLA